LNTNVFLEEMEELKLNEYRIAANPSYQNHCWLILRIPSPFFSALAAALGLVAASS